MDPIKAGVETGISNLMHEEPFFDNVAVNMGITFVGAEIGYLEYAKNRDYALQNGGTTADYEFRVANQEEVEAHAKKEFNIEAGGDNACRAIYPHTRVPSGYFDHRGTFWKIMDWKQALFTKTPGGALGVTVPEEDKLHHSIYLSAYAVSSWDRLNFVLGHEAIHSFHFSLGLRQLYDQDTFDANTERAACYWSQQNAARYGFSQRAYNNMYLEYLNKPYARYKIFNVYPWSK